MAKPIKSVNTSPVKRHGRGRTPITLIGQPFTPVYSPQPGQGLATHAAAIARAQKMEAERVVNGTPAHLVG